MFVEFIGFVVLFCVPLTEPQRKTVLYSSTKFTRSMVGWQGEFELFEVVGFVVLLS